MRAKLAATMKKTRFPDAPIVWVAANHADVEATIGGACSIVACFAPLSRARARFAQCASTPSCATSACSASSTRCARWSSSQSWPHARASIASHCDVRVSSGGPRRREQQHDADRFLFAFDHCFQVKGQGTVITGTGAARATRCARRRGLRSGADARPPVLRGKVEPNQVDARGRRVLLLLAVRRRRRAEPSSAQVIEFVGSGEQRKVKSIQQFHRPASECDEQTKPLSRQ